jgi:hypothetical protein
MKTKFKGETLTTTKVKNNILRVWDSCSEDEKYDWYMDANVYAKKISEENNYPHSVACGVIAALSPLKRWETNKAIAEDILKTGEAGHIETFVDKAKMIMLCDGSDETILEILNGRKISSFYMNIKNPSDPTNVTIDRHALSICLGRKVKEEDYRGITKNQYSFFVDCFKVAAEKVGVSPLLMQSATWVKFRKSPY